jgi:hypothetical protein
MGDQAAIRLASHDVPQWVARLRVLHSTTMKRSGNRVNALRYPD